MIVATSGFRFAAEPSALERTDTDGGAPGAPYPSPGFGTASFFFDPPLSFRLVASAYCQVAVDRSIDRPPRLATPLFTVVFWYLLPPTGMQVC